MFLSVFCSHVSIQYVMSISSLYIHLIVSESMQSAIKSGKSPWCVVNIKKAEEDKKTTQKQQKNSSTSL